MHETTKGTQFNNGNAENIEKSKIKGDSSKCSKVPLEEDSMYDSTIIAQSQQAISHNDYDHMSPLLSTRNCAFDTYDKVN